MWIAVIAASEVGNGFSPAFFKPVADVTVAGSGALVIAGSGALVIAGSFAHA